MASLFIVNKDGSLLYNFTPRDKVRLSSNEQLFLASTFYSLSVIAGKISPAADRSGIHVLEADTFKLQSFRAPTGMLFMAVAAPNHTNVEAYLRKVYELYSDYALKNPFYSLDMPIRCELFDKFVEELTQTFAF
eukprot:m.54627 g.54627  ORF g.54627 m.54627 type:complete len:134 (-) comp11912_c2_seq1:60-461(-)